MCRTVWCVVLTQAPIKMLDDSDKTSQIHQCAAKIAFYFPQKNNPNITNKQQIQPNNNA